MQMLSRMYHRNAYKRALSNVIARVAFWSYDRSRLKRIPDAQLIEAVLIHGGDALPKRLFHIFPEKKIRKVWEQEIIIQGEHYKELNLKIASDFLHISDPENYIQQAYSKYNLYDRFSSADA